MPWVKLDDSFWANPKVETVGNEAAGVYCRMLSYCGQSLTDGFIPGGVAEFILARKKKPLDALLDAGLIVAAPYGWRIPDYLDFNPSKEEVEAKRKVRSEAGKRGGERSSKRGSK